MRPFRLCSAQKFLAFYLCFLDSLIGAPAMRAIGKRTSGTQRGLDAQHLHLA